MKSSNRYTKYLAMITASLLSGGSAKSCRQPKELSHKDRKKCKSCKHCRKRPSYFYCECKSCSVYPLNAACDEYTKRKK